MEIIGINEIMVIITDTIWLCQLATGMTYE